MTFDTLVMQVFSGFSLFSVLVLMALGLTIVFGLMGVINMAHGELMAMGAYMTYVTSVVFQRYLPELMGWYFIVAIGVAFLMTFAFGFLLERCFIRFMYNRPLDTLLATWGLSLVLQQVFRQVFGPKEVSVPTVQWLQGAWKVSEGLELPINRIFNGRRSHRYRRRKPHRFSDLYELLPESEKPGQRKIRSGVQDPLWPATRDRRPDGSRLHRCVPVEKSRRESGQFRRAERHCSVLGDGTGCA